MTAAMTHRKARSAAPKSPQPAPQHAYESVPNRTIRCPHLGQVPKRKTPLALCQGLFSKISPSEADGTRTRNHRIDSQPDDSPNPRDGRGLRDAATPIAAQTAAPGSDGPHDPDLAALIAAWSDLPEPVRAGSNAMVRAATTGR